MSGHTIVCDVAALGAYLARLRMEHGLSLADVGRAAGVSKGAVASLESGDGGVPELTTLLRLAVALDVSPAHMLDVLLPDMTLTQLRGGLARGPVELLVLCSSLVTLPAPVPPTEPPTGSTPRDP